MWEPSVTVGVQGRRGWPLTSHSGYFERTGAEAGGQTELGSNVQDDQMPRGQNTGLLPAALAPGSVGVAEAQPAARCAGGGEPGIA